MSDDRMQPAKEPWFVQVADFIASRGFRTVLWCLFLLAIGWIPGAFVLDGWESRRERDRLLHHTDHHALLKACRELMRQHPDVSIGDPDHDPRVPDVIRRLGASYITINPDRVHIELHGGFDHYGVEAFAESADRERGLKLIDGLWYFSEGG